MFLAAAICGFLASFDFLIGIPLQAIGNRCREEANEKFWFTISVTN
jgi:hypothetical protein